MKYIMFNRDYSSLLLQMRWLFTWLFLRNLMRKCDSVETRLKRYQLSPTSFPQPISRFYHKFSSRTAYKYRKPPRKVSCSTRFKFCRYRAFDICRGDRNKRSIFIFFIFTRQLLRVQPKTIIKIKRPLLYVSILCRFYFLFLHAENHAPVVLDMVKYE